MGGRDELMDQHHVMTTNSEEGQRERGQWLHFLFGQHRGQGQDWDGGNEWSSTWSGWTSTLAFVSSMPAFRGTPGGPD